MRITRSAVVGAALLVGAAGLAACDDISTVMRPSGPVVLTGAQLPDLVGEQPGRIVAFRHIQLGDDATWTQIPVQVDERRVVDFGSQPGNNTTPGVTGTVYGTAAIGVTALQYTDPNTFVGPDTNTAFDADDELVFMVEDAGGRQRDGAEDEPPGVVPGSGVRVQLDDPLGPDRQAWVYLFLSDTLAPSAGLDYVDYHFTLTSGAYKTTYKRADGPNPETSAVVTDNYRIGFTDRWYETSWQIDAGNATGADILDANRNMFAIGFCNRSNATFADAEGAFVANIDGPVRAIRSYLGANSGPLTQRTHLLYRAREDVLTDLRVHGIPSVMDYVDFSVAAVGMTYRSSTVPGGVTIDGVPDAVGTDRATWEAVHGPQGTVFTAVRQQTSIANFDAGVDWYYRDLLNPPDNQCWGDSNSYGASGAWVTAALPNTDPRTLPFETMRTQRYVQFAEPPPFANIPTRAADWSAAIDTPLTVTVHCPHAGKLTVESATVPTMDPSLRAAAEAARGFMPPDEGLALHDGAVAAAAAGPGPFLEVGSYCGKSSVYLGAAARVAGRVLFAVDHHRGSEENQEGWEWHEPDLVDPAVGRMDTLPLFRRTVHDAGVEDVVIAVVGQSPVVAANWATPLSFLFIDGGHGVEPARADFAGWTPHVAPGGTLAIHDVFPDPTDGGRPPYEQIYLPALEAGFEEMTATGSLRLLRRPT